MNRRRDALYGRYEFGRHNAELEEERHAQDDWRPDAQRAQEDWRRFENPREHENYGGGWRNEGMASPMTPSRRYPNEGLANDFSIEGTRNFSRDDRRELRVSHRGKGPKGFERSDERIREEVSEILMDHHDIDASEIEVTVKDGEVTLAGTVGDRHTKRLAERVLDHVSGVVDVHNTIRVVRPDVRPSAPVANGRSAPHSRPH
jgi:hypothetical protein